MFHPNRSHYERAERERPGVFETWRDLMKLALLVVVTAGIAALVIFAVAIIALMVFGVV